MLPFSTGEKPNACPDCDFCTADPGCLTRHRKRKHGYVPIRKTAKIGPTTGTKQSRRHNPYQRNDKLASMASPSSSTSDNTFDDFDAFRAMTFSFPSASEAVCDEAQSVFSYSWDKSLFTSDVPSTLSGLDASEDFSSMLFKLSPGVDTCSQLHNGLDFSFDAMDLFPVQQQSQYFPAIYPADSSLEPSMFAPSAEVAWALNSEAFQAPTLYSLPEFPASSPNSSLSDLSSPLSFALLSPSPTDYTFTNLDVIH
ncbi:hypothetical protein H0H87_007713 [Tephrocybe sp. NHM501043]|nr:hypothetical protein H0H87_007713 [Tephrocybe sp. NHM501043]